MPKVGVVGSLVWDLIHGRDPLAPPTEEWGGIAYALGGLDASLPSEWEIVPLIKVGRDLAPQAAELLGGLSRLTPGGRCVEVPAPNNRVVLHYQSAERRCERMSGGVPAWTWLELGPMVRDLDAALCEFHLRLRARRSARRRRSARVSVGRSTPTCTACSSACSTTGSACSSRSRTPTAWFGCFDVVQLNEDEMRQLSPDPLSLSAQALGAGVSMLVVTLGPKGAAYVAAPGFDGWPAGGQAVGRSVSPPAGRPPDRPTATVRSALVPAPYVEALDPTGCGDVFGAAACARLLAGDGAEAALAHATAMAARNAMLRGAGGLSRHLRGELLVP